MLLIFQRIRHCNAKRERATFSSMYVYMLSFRLRCMSPIHVLSWLPIFSYVMKLTRSTIPEHARPSPMYPALQVQLKDPNVFVQFAFTWQLFMPLSHSLISISYKELKEKYTNEILNLTNEKSRNKYVQEFLQLWIKQFSLRPVLTWFMQSSSFVFQKKAFRLLKPVRLGPFWIMFS